MANEARIDPSLGARRAANLRDRLRSAPRQRRPRWQHNNSVGHGLRVGQQQPRVREKLPERLHAMAAGPKIFPRQHVLLVQRGHDLVPSSPAIRRDLEQYILEVVPFGFVVGDKREALKPCERPRYRLGN